MIIGRNDLLSENRTVITNQQNSWFRRRPKPLILYDADQMDVRKNVFLFLQNYTRCSSPDRL